MTFEDIINGLRGLTDTEIRQVKAQCNLIIQTDANKTQTKRERENAELRQFIFGITQAVYEAVGGTEKDAAALYKKLMNGKSFFEYIDTDEDETIKVSLKADDLMKRITQFRDTYAPGISLGRVCQVLCQASINNREQRGYRQVPVAIMNDIMDPVATLNSQYPGYLDNGWAKSIFRLPESQ